MKFSIEDFFSKYDQICIFLRIWSHLLKKSLMENFIFCAVLPRILSFHQFSMLFPESLWEQIAIFEAVVQRHLGPGIQEWTK